MPSEQDIVAKLWHLCNILRESGITYPEYVTELTYLLFLRMAEETGSERDLPEGYRWGDLASKVGAQQFPFYKSLLHHLGTSTKGRIKEIFSDADTCLTNPKHLAQLVTELGKIDWYIAREETALADVYEGLLEKNSTESKAGAGQYFTPRPVVESMVEVIRPQSGEIIQDPACGTAGFLITADRYIRRSTDNLKGRSTREKAFQRNNAFVGVELVAKTHRLALMNALLHGIHSPILLGDTLGQIGAKLPVADVILTNPPFGAKKGGGLPERSDLHFPTSNKQLCFLQHIYLGLAKGGRAAVVLPDNVLFDDATGAHVREELMELCNLHTILRLPTGIFYAAGVKTNVLFFTKAKAVQDNTKVVWIYDMRTNMRALGKRHPLEREQFADFEAAYGADPNGKSPRKDEGENGRFRCFTRNFIAERRNNLDITWLRAGAPSEANDLPSTEILVGNVLKKLKLAMDQIQKLQSKVSNK